jgi:hypothetical protein
LVKLLTSEEHKQLGSSDSMQTEILGDPSG